MARRARVAPRPRRPAIAPASGCSRCAVQLCSCGAGRAAAAGSEDAAASGGGAARPPLALRLSGLAVPQSSAARGGGESVATSLAAVLGPPARALHGSSRESAAADTLLAPPRFPLPPPQPTHPQMDPKFLRNQRYAKKHNVVAAKKN